jgi:hypothetical protein
MGIHVTVFCVAWFPRYLSSHHYLRSSTVAGSNPARDNDNTKRFFILNYNQTWCYEDRRSGGALELYSEVLASNLGRYTSYFDWRYSWFSSIYLMKMKAWLCILRQGWTWQNLRTNKICYPSSNLFDVLKVESQCVPKSLYHFTFERG